MENKKGPLVGPHLAVLHGSLLSVFYVDGAQSPARVMALLAWQSTTALECYCIFLGAEPGLRCGGVPCFGYGAAAQVCL